MRFNQKSSSYEKYATVQRALVNWGARVWLPRFPKEHFLELGAGTGILTKELLAQGFRISATDIAPQMILQGKQQCPNAEWHNLDAWEPCLAKKNAYDGVASAALLQWALDPIAVLKQWRMLVKQGGSLKILLFAAPSLSELSSLCPKASPFTWRTADDWRYFTQDAGWSDVNVDSLTQKMEYTNVNSFFRSLHGVGATQGKQLSISAMKQLMQEYTQNFSSVEGVFATWTFLRIEASNLLR